MRKLFEIGGLVAAAVLIAFGVTAIVMGVNGRSTVRDSLKLEQITGSPDMTPSAIAAEAKKAGLPATIDLPTTDVAGKPIDTRRPRPGVRLVHAHPHARGNRGRDLRADGALRKPGRRRRTAREPTSDAQSAARRDERPVDNGARNIWVTETALTTALNTSYMADSSRSSGSSSGSPCCCRASGSAILAVGGALRNPDSALASGSRSTGRARRRSPAV